ncbi:hypothetical protein AB0F93_03215 [Micromonospora tulbaghiae]|uniref:hypothetical protein n=1 Tax=Micromonospora TaxID=1873 RepID=UPI0008274E25|nr:hypothetical protein [Micromonospora aurantiaca]SCL40061.1 hypothetical protein GA0070615_4260 [Micromonospora aurantiaca]
MSTRKRYATIGALALAAVLSGGAIVYLSGDDQAATATAAPSSTPNRPAPLPSQDWPRLACHTLPSDLLDLLDNLADTRKAAEHAMKADNATIRQRGTRLRDAVTDREVADLNGDHNAAVDANLAISRASVDLSEACAVLYGDGPW